MIDKFDACHAITAKWEGGWSDHPSDPGGKTMYGVTQATLSEWLGRPATGAEIRSLTKQQALAIYRDRYWKRVGGDQLPPGVDLCVYDFGVNSGPGRAVKSLQAALGAKADGWVGELTIEALRNVNLREIVNTLCDRRLAFLKSIRDKDGNLLWATFGKGWGNRVADVRRRALAMATGAPQPQPNLRDISVIGPEGTPKAIPAPPSEKTVSTEQKVGGAAAGTAIVVTTLGPLAGFWRDNKDVLTDPVFVVVALILTAVIVFMLFKRPASVEEQA